VILGLLQKIGISPTLVANGEQALNWYSKDVLQFDVILMDCEMPVMDGFTATENIRQYETENGFKPIPIIALTAHVTEEHIQKAKECGMDHHLSKPVNLEKLYKLLARIKTKMNNVGGSC